MPRGIIKIKDKYFEWSTVVDAPVTCAMNMDELKEHIKARYGSEGLDDLPDRLFRVDKDGCSFHDRTLDDVICCNRAGDNEEHLSSGEIYEQYAERR